MEKPLVSVIIPTFNYARYVGRAVESCLNQTYDRIEVIVVDDGSQDNTRELIKKYEAVRYVYQQHSGVSRARNRGLKLARGQFINFLDADDYLTNDSIEIKLRAFREDESIGAVVTETYSEKGGRIIYHPRSPIKEVSDKFYESLLVGEFPLSVCGVLIKADIAKRFHFPEGYSNGEDIAYFSKIFFSTKVKYLRVPTAVTVWHGDSLRHNLAELNKSGLNLVDLIIDDPFFEGKLNHLRKSFYAKRSLELFRKLYRYGDKTNAKKYFITAVRARPLCLLKIEYLLKFLICLIKPI